LTAILGFTASVNVAGVVPLVGVTVMKLPGFEMLALGAKVAVNGIPVVLLTAIV
jgi:hypothetical protein